MVVTTKLHIKKNDYVEVISGKEKGKRGKVLRVFTKNNRAIVEKINMIKRHSRPSKLTQQGGIIEKEGTIHISNLQVVCDNCGRGVKISRKALDDGKRVGVCKRCGEVLEKKG
ncbi:MAG: 50S ribosomal protein L24 [Candidatus Tectomicrobia bacterium]|uniref:Large ribosomal subunit protein uL24 n=1 Tax=Tectimicrobiota bacterium TaxID=2528274 RepID=A0A933GNV4_UNCTE|nr:50S ribosomal protein L24 [Candidatus Tectomicrobia bacterium]